MNTEITTTAHETTSSNGNLWSGGLSPFRTSYGKLMMWYFLLSDAFTFAGFLIAYGALRSSMNTWPVPDFVFSTFPGLTGSHPLLFVTFMTFVLLFSSYTMMRAVQEGHRENKSGVVRWMILTIIGGIGFLSCQAWEWTTLIGGENMTVVRDPFGSHIEKGVYLTPEGTEGSEVFEPGKSYLIHKIGGHGHADDHAPAYHGAGSYPDAVVDEEGFIHRKYKVLEGPNAGQIKAEEFGPKAFGALFFFITGFHGFHVLSGVVFLIIVMLNVASGLYMKRKNGHEMVEKIGLYWHFVDLVWVFVFLVFYLI
jgi:cytochrome c oxidase subunit 3